MVHKAEAKLWICDPVYFCVYLDFEKNWEFDWIPTKTKYYCILQQCPRSDHQPAVLDLHYKAETFIKFFHTRISWKRILLGKSKWCINCVTNSPSEQFNAELKDMIRKGCCWRAHPICVKWHFLYRDIELSKPVSHLLPGYMQAHPQKGRHW